MGRTLHRGPLTEEQSALAASWFHLAKKVSGQWQMRYPQIGESDLQSATHMALVKAARAYRPEMERSFAALLCTCMRQELLDVVKAYVARKGNQQRFWIHRRWTKENGWYEYQDKDEPGQPKLLALMKHVLNLYHNEGLTLQEIAQLLGSDHRRISELLRSPLAEAVRNMTASASTQ